MKQLILFAGKAFQVPRGITRSMILCMLTLSFIGVGLNSCSEEEVPGCTDPGSDSYNSEATTDDGSCTYERDIFIGTYMGALVCPDSQLLSSDDEIVTIGPLSDNTNGLNLNFLCCPQLNFDGFVENGIFKINDFRIVQGFPYKGQFYDDATYSYTGEGKFENGKLIIDGLAKLTNSQGSTVYAFNCAFIQD